MLDMEYVERLESGIDQRDDEIMELKRKNEELQEQLSMYKPYIERIKRLATKMYDVECVASDAQDLLNNMATDLED